MMLALLLLAAADAQVAAPAPVPSISPTRSFLLPAFTPVRLVTQAAIDSRSVRQGQRFALTVTEDVSVGDRIVIPRGTPAVGEIEAVAKKSTGGNAGRLVLVPLFIEWNGDRIYLRGRSEADGQGAVGASVATQILLSPLGVLISGRSASVPAGSSLDGEVRNNVMVIAR